MLTLVLYGQVSSSMGSSFDKLRATYIFGGIRTKYSVPYLHSQEKA